MVFLAVGLNFTQEEATEEGEASIEAEESGVEEAEIGCVFISLFTADPTEIFKDLSQKNPFLNVSVFSTLLCFRLCSFPTCPFKKKKTP